MTAPESAPGQAERFALGELVREAAGEIKRCRSVTVVCQPCEAQIAAVLLAADAYAEAAAQVPKPEPTLAVVDLHRWYAVITQPDGTSKVIGHTSDGLGYYDSVDEWEAKNS